MKTKCDNVRWVDQFDIKIELTKEDIGDLLTWEDYMNLLDTFQIKKLQ